MRRPRPHIPLSVRVEVAERQLNELAALGKIDFIWLRVTRETLRFMSGADGLAMLLEELSKSLGDGLQLDHDPALILRQYKVDRRKPVAAWYTPNANDPAHLIYRPEREHDQKTFGRRADAEKTVTTKGSDIWLKSKFRRLESPSKKPRAKIAQRKKPWPKGRKLPARPFPR